MAQGAGNVWSRLMSGVTYFVVQTRTVSAMTEGAHCAVC